MADHTATSTIPTTRDGWQAAAVGCYWSYGPYTICTVSGPTLGGGYVLTYNREEIPGPSSYGPNWNTFEAAAHAAGRHAGGEAVDHGTPTCKRCGARPMFSDLRAARWALVNPHVPGVVHYPAGTILCSGCEEIGRPKDWLPEGITVYHQDGQS